MAASVVVIILVPMVMRSGACSEDMSESSVEQQ